MQESSALFWNSASWASMRLTRHQVANVFSNVRHDSLPAYLGAWARLLHATSYLRSAALWLFCCCCATAPIAAWAAASATCNICAFRSANYFSSAATRASIFFLSTITDYFWLSVLTLCCLVPQFSYWFSPTSRSSVCGTVGTVRFLPTHFWGSGCKGLLLVSVTNQVSSSSW